MTTTQPAQPEISIIIPARNEEASLASCLESLVGQTAVSFEIIVVNDHSADREAPFQFHRVFPEQVVSGFWQRAVMPVIFAELAAHYRPSEVNDPNSPAAAANGQYILISREAYDAVGGHAAVAAKILEDVELAWLVKRSGRKILFRFAGDAVRTRMYRSFSQLREGWTKNLAILFPAPARLAVWRLSEFVALVLSLVLPIFFVASRQFLIAPLFLMGPVFTFRRIARAHFPWP